MTYAPETRFGEFRFPGMLKIFFGADPADFADAQARHHGELAASFEAVRAAAGRGEVELTGGRRAVLESVPFFTGYAVETGLLIDILESVGLPAIGQVDLERRIHRNQPLGNLSQMSYVILQAAIRKLEERHRIELLTEMGRGMKQIIQEQDRFSLEVREIGDELRPPIKTIPAYQERRRTLKKA